MGLPLTWALLGLLAGAQIIPPDVLALELPGTLSLLGKGAVFFALGLLPFLILYGSRSGALEPLLGLEVMSRTHRILAVITLSLLFLHSGSLSLRHSLLLGAPVYSLLPDYFTLWEMAAGVVALLLLLCAAGCAVAGRSRGRSIKPLPYWFWRPAHLLVYGGMVLGFSHAFGRGTDLENPWVLSWVVGNALLVILAAGARILERCLGDKHFPAHVVSVRPETASVSTVTFTADAATPLWFPGQFMMLQLRRAPGWRGLSAPHPFTIACAPGGHLCCTVKRIGKFTQAVHQLQPGAPVHCSGPYGIFLRGATEQPRIGLVAGGVGITPFLSLMRACDHDGARVAIRLLWSNKTRDELFALEELAALQSRLDLEIVYALTREKAAETIPDLGAQVHLGRINGALLARLYSGSERFYLCGPPGFPQGIARTLRTQLSVPKRNISWERFAW